MSVIRENHTLTADGCQCPVCRGLTCNERPRFYDGQILRAKDLEGQQAYGIAKQKLHNRYLHGKGIVCGLEVTCHDCDSRMVTIHPGYALDACGNDVVVCDAYDFDIIKAIEACTREERKQCDPWRNPPARDCSGYEQEWCVTIRYTEKMGQPSATLISQTNGRCGCGQTSGSCGCGTKTNGTATATRTRAAKSCEPSLVIESFEIGVVRLPDTSDDDDQGPLVELLWNLINKLGFHLPLEEIMACFNDLVVFFNELVEIGNLLSGDDAFENRHEAGRRFCLLLNDLSDYVSHHNLTKCELLTGLNQIVCPPVPATDDGFELFLTQMRNVLLATLSIIINLLIDCFCYELLPKCPEEVCEDRLLLACVTVQDGRVVRICHSPRQYTLTPHNFFSAFLAVAFSELCCQQFDFNIRDGIRGRVDSADTFSSRRGFSARANAFTPAFVAAAMENEATLTPDIAAGLMGSAARSPLAAEMLNAVRSMGFDRIKTAETAELSGAAVDPMAILGKDAGEVQEMLGDRVIATEQVSWNSAESFLRNLESVKVGQGDTVRLHVDKQNRVVGVSKAAEGEHLEAALASANARIAKLEQQIAAILEQGGGANG